MALVYKAPFVQSARRVHAVLTAAKTTYGDLTNAVELFTTNADGSWLTKLSARPRATVTATQLQLYLSDGTTHYLTGSALMPAYTMAATTAIPATAFLDDNGQPFSDQNPLQLPKSSGTTWKVFVAAGVALAGGIVVAGEVLDFGG